MVLLFGYLDTSMFMQTIFRFPSGRRKAQHVLQRMVERGDLARFKPEPRSPYVYHIGRRSLAWQHTYRRNIFHFSLLAALRDWHSLKYEFEFDFGGGRADGFYIIKNNLTGTGVKFFLEVDSRRDEFDKVLIYNQRFADKSWHKLWWADPGGAGKPVFPRVVVLTERPERVRQAVTKQNRGGLQFVVCTIAEAKENMEEVVVL